MRALLDLLFGGMTEGGKTVAFVIYVLLVLMLLDWWAIDFVRGLWGRLVRRRRWRAWVRTYKRDPRPTVFIKADTSAFEGVLRSIRTGR